MNGGIRTTITSQLIFISFLLLFYITCLHHLLLSLAYENQESSSQHCWHEGQIILCCRSCTVRCRMLGDISILYQLGATNSPLNTTVTAKNVTRHCQVPLENDRISPQDENYWCKDRVSCRDSTFACSS